MITIFSGVPGSGKTAAMVDYLMKNHLDRPLYVINLDGLKIPHIELKDPYNWMDCPDGSLIVIDEVQKYWRASNSAATLHESIKELEEHRHRGFDFLIATQRPSLIHSNVRGLAERHIHLRNVGVLGRYWYEWPECNDSPNTAWKNAPIKHRYRLPTKAFEQYKSASMHVKPIKGFPRILFTILILIVASFFIGRYLYSKLSGNFSDDKKPTTSAAAASPKIAPGEIMKAGLVDERIDFIPREYNKPWTAPAYDHLRQVVNMPRITSALCVNSKCDCYDGQDRLDIADATCHEWAVKRPFNPYVPRASEATQNYNPGRPGQPGQATSPGQLFAPGQTTTPG